VSRDLHSRLAQLDRPERAGRIAWITYALLAGEGNERILELGLDQSLDKHELGGRAALSRERARTADDAACQLEVTVPEDHRGTVPAELEDVLPASAQP
jgi:hypothetical protein